MRVLHLIDPGVAGWPALDALARLLRSEASASEHGVLLIGGSDDERLAARLGVRTLDRIHPPNRRAEHGARLLARYLEARGEPNVFHAWSALTARLASAVRPRTPRVATLAAGPCAHASQPISLSNLLLAPWRDSAPAPCEALFASEADRDQWAEAGLEGRVAPLPIDPARFDPTLRAAARSAWGVGDEVLVIGLLGEPAGEMDARQFAFVLGLMAAAGRRVAGVLPPGAHDLERALRFVERQRRPWPMIGARELEEAPWTVIGALDAAVWQPRTAPADVQGRARAHSLAWAMAARIPTVAAALRPARELCEGTRESGDGLPRLAPPGDPHALAVALLESTGAGESASRALDEARDRIVEAHSPARWAAAVAEAYERAIVSGGRTRPAPEPGASLRP